MSVLREGIASEVSFVSQRHVVNIWWLYFNSNYRRLSIVIIHWREVFRNLKSNELRIIVLHSLMVNKLAIRNQLILASNYIN